MPDVSYTIPLIIEYSAIAQVLVDRDIRKANFAGNQVLDKRHSRLLYMERAALTWYNTYGTNATALNQMGNYVLKLIGRYLQEVLTIIGNLSQSIPVITGPTNDSVNVGDNAIFSVAVVSSLPYILQWYRNGVPIVGATGLTYTLSNAQITDNGSTFSVRATNAAGVGVSATATLTVNAGLVASYYFGGTDYSNDINAGNDDVAYVGTFPITSGQSLSFIWPSGAANQFLVVRYPVTESTKTAYANAPINNGVIPGLAFDNVKTIGGFKYIFSRNGNVFGFTTTNALIFS